jgi:hypothetical protein
MMQVNTTLRLRFRPSLGDKAKDIKLDAPSDTLTEFKTGNESEDECDTQWLDAPGLISETNTYSGETMDRRSRMVPPIAENRNLWYATAAEPTVGKAYTFPDPDTHWLEVPKFATKPETYFDDTLDWQPTDDVVWRMSRRTVESAKHNTVEELPEEPTQKWNAVLRPGW